MYYIEGKEGRKILYLKYKLIFFFCFFNNNKGEKKEFVAVYKENKKKI